MDLTREQYSALIAQPCTYCGNPLNESGSGLDRLDDSAGYTLSNLVPACWPCNWLRHRGAFTYDEMKRLGPTLGPIWKVHPPRGTQGGKVGMRQPKPSNYV
jgi:hypothetical protein